MAKAKRNAKDSVFGDLFSRKEYLLQLYRSLHPEDTDTTEDMLQLTTLKRILVNRVYNDLGFFAGDRLMILMEAQSTWSVNILPRVLFYIADSYQQYFGRRHANLYSTHPVCMPEPEVYVIYTGERKEHPDVLKLSREFFGGKDISVEVSAKVLYGEDKSNILGQYVRFCKVLDGCIAAKGYTDEAILDTIRICKDEHVLTAYLQEHETEAITLMKYLFDDEYIRARMCEEERDEGRTEGRTEGRILQMIEIYDEDHVDHRTIAQRLMDKFRMTAKDAADWLARYAEEKKNGSLFATV